MTDTKIIAIDGPAASGKGTIAKRLAKELNYAHMDTGALYRLVGMHVLQASRNPENENEALSAAKELKDCFTSDMTESEDIRSDEVGQAASQVGQFQSVRDVLYELQVDFANNPPAGKSGSVLDGRDIGTVICPYADVKLYITASTEVRAERRTKELQSKGFDMTYDDVLKDMKRRDERDSGRDAAPMKPAEDAIQIDTSEMGAEEAYQKALNTVKLSIT